MDYTQEIITSSLWIARTLALTVIILRLDRDPHPL